MDKDDDEKAQAVAAAAAAGIVPDEIRQDFMRKFHDLVRAELKADPEHYKLRAAAMMDVLAYELGHVEACIVLAGGTNTVPRRKHVERCRRAGMETVLEMCDEQNHDCASVQRLRGELTSN